MVWDQENDSSLEWKSQDILTDREEKTEPWEKVKPPPAKFSLHVYFGNRGSKRRFFFWKSSPQGLQSQTFGPAILLESFKSVCNSISWLENYLTFIGSSVILLLEWLNEECVILS